MNTRWSYLLLHLMLSLPSGKNKAGRQHKKPPRLISENAKICYCSSFEIENVADYKRFSMRRLKGKI
jgi:hypothetical protein